MRDLGTLLATPNVIVDRCRQEPDLRRFALHTCLAIVFGGAAFGAAVGSFRGGSQLAFAAIKLPLATLATLAVAGPALMAIANAFDRGWSLRESVALLLAAGARASLVLLALAPALWMVVGFGAGYHALKLCAALAYGTAGLSGLSFLLRALGDRPGRLPGAAIFVVVFSVAGAQSAWVLRPYIGDPRDRNVPVLAHGVEHGGVAGALFESLSRR
jgi:hypothetical protein